MHAVLKLKTDQRSIILEELKALMKAKTFIGLRGGMGAGKTTLISHLLSDQRVAVSSPTFALYNSYPAFGLTIVHVDLYRLESPEEIESSGFWDLFADTDAVILTEWSERLAPNEIPLDWAQWALQIDILPDANRTYSLYKIG